MIACASTDVAAELCKTDLLQNNALARTGDRSRSAINEKYVVMIDGARDVDYSISELNYSTIIQPDGAESSITSSFVGEMKVNEFRNAVFIFDLLQAAVATGAKDITSMPILIKTFIIGETPDGNNEVISDIAPLTVTILNASAVIDATSTSYNIFFVSYVDGLSGVRPYEQMNTNKVCIKSTGTSVLKEVLDDFAIQLNEQATKDYDNLVMKASTAGNSKYNEIIHRKFEIVTHPYYDNSFLLSVNPTNTDNGNPNDPGYISLAPTSASVNAAFRQIFNLVPKFNSDKGPYPGSNSKEVFAIVPKIKLTVERIPTSSTGNNKRYDEKIRIEVYPRYLPLGSGKKILDGNFDVPPGNLLTFDYYYSGKNIDIIDFDLKLDSLQQLLVATQRVGQPDVDITDPTKSDQSGPDTSNTGTLAVPSTDANVGATVAIPRALSSQGIAATDMSKYKDRLQSMSGIQGIRAKLKIRGNPDFYSNLTNNLSSTTNPPGNALGEQWRQTPMFAKVNVTLPVRGEGFLGGEFTKVDTQKFWYNGLYEIFSVEHSFSGAQFTQTLDMVARLDQEGSLV